MDQARRGRADRHRHPHRLDRQGRTAHRAGPQPREVRPAKIRKHLYNFYLWCADSDITEITRLATTIETWWDGIEAFLRTGITNAKSEGINRAVKLAARNAYGLRNPENQRLRTRTVTNKVTVPG